MNPLDLIALSNILLRHPCVNWYYRTHETGAGNWRNAMISRVKWESFIGPLAP